MIAFPNAGGDTVNCIKQAQEFGLTGNGTRLAGLLILVNIVKALGLETAQGLLLTESFYWDLNPRTRAFMDRLRPKVPTNYPNCTHAAMYSATLHYLKAAAALGPIAMSSAEGGVCSGDTGDGLPSMAECSTLSSSPIIMPSSGCVRRIVARNPAAIGTAVSAAAFKLA